MFHEGSFLNPSVSAALGLVLIPDHLSVIAPAPGLQRFEEEPSGVAVEASWSTDLEPWTISPPRLHGTK